MRPVDQRGNGSFASVRERREAERHFQRLAAEERRWARRAAVQRIAIGSAVVIAAASLLAYVRVITAPGQTLLTNASAVSRAGQGPSGQDPSGSQGAGTTLAGPAGSTGSAGSAGWQSSRPAPSTVDATGSGAAASSGASPGTSGAGPRPPAGYAGIKPSASSQAVRMYGVPRSGLPWQSGFFTGGDIGTAHIDAAGTWRGTPMDFATVYPLYGTWKEIQGSGWAVTSYRGFKGHLSYGLPLLPKDRKGHWEDVTDGSHDAVFRGIAQLLVSSGQPDAAIRMGVEANGYWFPWAVDTSTTDEFKAAFRHVVTVMRAVAPRLTFWLDLNCGTVLTGSADRLAPLTQMYPGDDVTDGISMDHYDAYKLGVTDELSWQVAAAPSYAPGLQDGVDFARAHHKGFAVPEWGLHGKQGPGDSPYFMSRIFQFFMDNRDVLVYEDYFNEPASYIQSGLFESTKNPASAAVYRDLWGRRF